ncbi:MAG TPA: hypothetical protein VGJ55_12560 [Pyrinomonadaceae bacterium]|jgi:hypothetical protein
MRRKKRTEVFTETQVEIEIRGRTRRLSPVWCAECGSAVEWVPPDVAALVAEVSARAIFGWVEAGRVHFTETTEGALLVCLNSLPQALSAPADGAGLSTDGAARVLSAHEETAPHLADDGPEGCESVTKKD